MIYNAFVLAITNHVENMNSEKFKFLIKKKSSFTLLKGLNYDDNDDSY